MHENVHPLEQPMISTDLSDYPWQKIATDLFQLKGRNYLFVVDYFYRFPEIQQLSSTTSSSVVGALKTMRSQFGVPEIVISSNVHQYNSSEFAKFSEGYDFSHVTSSPLFAQSNSQAECMVKTVKKLLDKCTDPHQALLSYQSTPLAWCALSPAELLMGSRLHANIAILKSQLIPKWKYLDEFQNKNHSYKQKQKRNFDCHHGAHALTPFPTISMFRSRQAIDQLSGQGMRFVLARNDLVLESNTLKLLHSHPPPPYTTLSPPSPPP